MILRRPRWTASALPLRIGDRALRRSGGEGGECGYRRDRLSAGVETAWSRSGDPEIAEQLSTALTAMGSGFTRAEAGLRCGLAAALHVRGERIEARRHLARAGN